MLPSRWLVNALRAEDGSLPIALLAVIVSGGIMLSATATVVAGHRGVNFDRDHVGVIQVADAGVQDALFRMSHPDPAQRLIPPTTTPRSVPGTTATYEVVAAGTNSWQIRSTATAGGTQ